jgi:hypothetical protein
MKQLILIITTVFFALAPALVVADETPQLNLSNVPKETLIQGLDIVGVCVATDIFGMRWYTDLYSANKDDSTAAGTEAARAEKDADDLYEVVQVEVAAAQKITKVLKSQYNMTDEDISNEMVNVMTATNEGLTDKLGKIDDIDEFTTEFKDARADCSKAIDSFVDNVKKYQSNLENKPKDDQI